ncbi:hypothetical protein [Frankia sp. R82]|uniref:hypothetical protein n=1 Tax=Frankia sp. R82 TaxID=2950553 RepID=UPI0020431138|nr:hypothetical protein [Frankia sp. R82]MCM3882711.1 hypothetical protein [Frankia sp. R82]
MRPVDWDGSFTRTWASRDANAVTDRLADEFEDELAQQQADRLSRKYRDEANARADARQRVELDRLLEQPAGDDARPSLFDRLENFGRVWDDEDRGSPDAGSGDSAGPR